MKKKIVAFLVAMVMLIALLPTTAFAATGTITTKVQSKSKLTELKKGDVVNVSVIMPKVKLDTIGFDLVFDNAVFSCSNIKADTIAQKMLIGKATIPESAPNVLRVAFANTTPVELPNGMVAVSASFTVITDTPTNIETFYLTNLEAQLEGADADVALSADKTNIVIPTPPKYVEDVKLNASEITLSVNGKSQLTATVTPADADNTAVKWQSKNTKIATVDNTGTVTGVKVGKTKVTATSCDGTKIVATCVVNVVACTHAGTIKAVPAKDATCTEPGNKAYYTCTKCGAAFLDAEGNQSTTVAAQTIAAKGHELTETPAVEPDCKNDGKAAYWTCSECHKTFVKNGNKLVEVTDMNQLVIPSTGEHNWEFVEESKKNGYTLRQFKCSGCDTVEWDAFVGCNVSVTLVKDEKSKGDLKDADVTVTGYNESIKMSEGETIDIENVNIADVIGTGVDEDAAIAALKEKLENTTFTVKATAKKSGWNFDTVKTEVKFVITDNGVQAVVKDKDSGKLVAVKNLSFTIIGKKNTTPPSGGGSTTTDTTKTDGKKVQSGKTFDAGIAMYVGLSVLSVTGGALVIGKKKERF